MNGLVATSVARSHEHPACGLPRRAGDTTRKRDACGYEQVCRILEYNLSRSTTASIKWKKIKLQGGIEWYRGAQTRRTE